MTAPWPYSVEFTVPGTPQSQGNHRTSRTGHTYETNANLKPWRQLAVAAARQAKPTKAGDGFVWDGPVTVQASFYYTRPKSHFGTGKNASTLKASAPIYKTTASDTDKLARALGDVLEIAGVIRSDSLIVEWSAAKYWVTGPAYTVAVVRPVLRNSVGERAAA